MQPTIQQTERVETCPECDSPVRTTATAETACVECGLLVDDQAIDHGPDWRFTTEMEDSERHAGAPLSNTRANRGLSTWMGDCQRDGQGKRIEAEKRRRLHRQRMRQRRAAADANKDTLEPGLKETGRLCSELDLTDAVEETACVVYRRALDANLLYGWAYESIASAAVYIAARNTGAVRPLDEVVAASHHDQRRVARAVRHLQRELDLAVEPPAVVEYVPTISDDLGLSARLERLATTLLETAIDRNVHSGRDPSALAASALYTVTLAVPDTPDLCQTEISEAVSVSALTIRTHFRELRPLCPEALGVDPADVDAPASRSGTRASTVDADTETDTAATPVSAD